MYFTGRSLEATRTQVAVAEQGQLTDRFTKAVDQLDRAGADHLQARLGAIYALERLARDSSRDQPTFVEVLSAFIRTTTPQPVPTPTGTTPPADACPRQAVAPDIQAALTVLGRRDSTHDRAARIDLHGTCLAGADLHRADLGGALLRGADLHRADFSGALLRGTILNGANLYRADFYRADLHRAHLSFAVLDGAGLHGANLHRADLGGADLRRANLNGADLRDARHDEQTDITNVTIDQDTRGQWW
ncbi:hypothetical protein JOF41_000895 [Saccharothrix coeruleofusca]|uniref:pentapeptide repeat-containing protein n=2 Tax=Saccharothrix coeruleofusca TaxID=33919 RepID=UPI001AEA1392|nr:pentapeptide repeat-containing protein [Saccharothrix coeruleofusca]MBP2334717.1 hypothetical protein [Saccharothrix coeruleofusca]